jgi:hypothetical protein
MVNAGFPKRSYVVKAALRTTTDGQKPKGTTAKIKRDQSLMKRMERGQYLVANGNRLATPEPFLNSADADRMSVEVSNGGIPNRTASSALDHSKGSACSMMVKDFSSLQFQSIAR